MGCCGSSSSLAEKVLHLRNSPFCLHMSTAELEGFAAHFTVKQYPKGSCIYDEAVAGTEFFILVEGEVDMTALDGDGQDQFLCTKKPGDFFGERAILMPECQREATVTCTVPCKTLVISKKSYDKYTRDVGSTMTETLSQVMGERMLNCIKKIEFLSTLNDWQLQFLSNLFHFQIVEKDEKVFEEGDLGRQMYVVSQGTVKINARDKDGKEVFFATLHSGQVFGEIALMVDMPRTATVTATERCLLLVLGLDDFTNFLHVVPELKDHFEKVVKDRTAEQFKKFNVPFFENFSPDQLRELANLCVLQKYDRDTVIVKEGDVGDTFYLVVHGELIVEKEGKGKVGTITAGRYFGEVALVMDQTRSATITAVTRCVLFALTKDNFQAFFRSTPDAYAEFAIKLSRRETPLTSILMHSKGRVYFTEHLAAEYSLENINFWLASGLYEEGTEEGLEVLTKRAIEIIDTFIDAKASQQVNIPAHKRNEVLQNFRVGKITPTMFAEARKEILKLMSADSFKRFKASERFDRLLIEVGSFEDGTAGASSSSSGAGAARASIAFTPPGSPLQTILGGGAGSAARGVSFAAAMRSMGSVSRLTLESAVEMREMKMEEKTEERLDEKKYDERKSEERRSAETTD